MEKDKSFYEKQIIIGFKTIVLGFVLFIIEFLSLPIFGTLQKFHVNGQGFESNFISYISWQPYPLIFFVTVIIILFGVIFLAVGYKGKRNK